MGGSITEITQVRPRKAPRMRAPWSQAGRPILLKALLGDFPSEKKGLGQKAGGQISTVNGQPQDSCE